MKKNLSHLFHKLVFAFLIIFCNNLVSQNLQWAKQYTGQNNTSSNYITSMAVDSLSGDIYTIGSFQGSVDFDPNSGVTIQTANPVPTPPSLFITKLNSSCNVIWVKIIDGTGNSMITKSSISIDPNGNVCVAGDFQGALDFDPGAATFTLSATGYEDMFVLKLNPQGNFVWAKHISSTYYSGANDITTDANGYIYTSGIFVDTVDFDPGPNTYTLASKSRIQSGPTDGFVLKLDPTGNFIWVRQIGDTTGITGVNSIAIDGIQNVYITGNFYGTIDFDPTTINTNTLTAANGSAFINKLDPSGNFMWVKNMDGGTTGSSGANSIALDNFGNIHISGWFGDAVDFDPGIGVNNLYTHNFNGDSYISKLDNLGNFIWAQQFNGLSTNTSENYINDLQIDNVGNVYTTGYFIDSLDVDPGIGIYALKTPSTTASTFVSKLNALGNFVWAKQTVSTPNSYCEGRSIALGSLGNIYIAGSFNETVDFDPSLATYNLICGSVAMGSSDSFIWKLGSAITTNINQENITLDSFNLYPNPNNGKFIVEVIDESTSADLIILNMLGQEVYKQKINKGDNTIHTILPKGIYYATLYNNKNSISKTKIVIH